MTHTPHAATTRETAREEQSDDDLAKNTLPVLAYSFDRNDPQHCTEHARHVVAGLPKKWQQVIESANPEREVGRDHQIIEELASGHVPAGTAATITQHDQPQLYVARRQIQACVARRCNCAETAWVAMCCAINTQLGAIGHSTWVFYLERGNDTLFLGSRTGFMSVDLLWAQSRTIYPFEQITISSDGHHIHQTWQSERGTGNVHATQLSDTQAQVTDYYAAVDDTHESRAAWIVGQYDDTICWAAWQIYLEWRLESRDPDYASIADGLVAGQYGELSEHDQKLVLGLAGDWEATSQALVETVRLLILN